MKIVFGAHGPDGPRWLRRGLAGLRQALSWLQRLVLVERQPEAMVLIPIRAVQPQSLRHTKRRTRLD